MKIAIFDFMHFEMVHVLHNMFNGSSHQIVFFTNNNILNKIKNSNLGNLSYGVVNKDIYNSREEFYKACEKYIIKNHIDLVHFNTIDEDYKLVWHLIKNINVPITLTVHNINTWLSPPFTLNRVALSNYYYRKRIVNKSKGLILQEDIFINYVNHKKLYKKPISVIPHTLKTIDNQHKENEHLRIAIPGSIDGNNRRNYQFALSAIEKISKINPEIKFVFLGKILSAEGEKIFNQISILKSKGCNVEHKYDPTTNKIFDDELNNCDIVFMPVKIHFKYEGIPEIYGQTKVTGVIYDMMRFQKPGIIPIEHVVPTTMESSILTYFNEEDFINQVLGLDKSKEKLNQLINKAKENSEYYSIESIKSRVLPFFELVKNN
jgi:hypothetical protein